jgi:hypothetical protein
VGLIFNSVSEVFSRRCLISISYLLAYTDQLSNSSVDLITVADEHCGCDEQACVMHQLVEPHADEEVMYSLLLPEISVELAGHEICDQMQHTVQ